MDPFVPGAGQVFSWGLFWQNLPQKLAQIVTNPMSSIGIILVIAAVIIGYLILRR